MEEDGVEELDDDVVEVEVTLLNIYQTSLLDRHLSFTKVMV